MSEHQARPFIVLGSLAIIGAGPVSAATARLTGYRIFVAFPLVSVVVGLFIAHR